MDQLRFLARRSELGYVAHVGLAVRREPEALSEGEQDEMSDAARRERSEQITLEWMKCSARLTSSLDHFEQVLHIGAGDRGLERTLRGMRRQVAVLDRLLGVR